MFNYCWDERKKKLSHDDLKQVLTQTILCENHFIEIEKILDFFTPFFLSSEIKKTKR